jgi:hypothetical protein
MPVSKQGHEYTCANCKAFHPVTEKVGEVYQFRYAQCRLRSPIIDDEQLGWPYVKPNDWCLESPCYKDSPNDR